MNLSAKICLPARKIEMVKLLEIVDYIIPIKAKREGWTRNIEVLAENETATSLEASERGRFYRSS